RSSQADVRSALGVFALNRPRGITRDDARAAEKAPRVRPGRLQRGCSLLDGTRSMTITEGPLGVAWVRSPLTLGVFRVVHEARRQDHPVQRCGLQAACGTHCRAP